DAKFKKLLENYTFDSTVSKGYFENTKFKKGKTVYVRVCICVKAGRYQDKEIRSKWSSVKKLKLKK
ncbi:MAG: hypothetical protein IJ733_18640, partial [Lachnospiraceae bacterium]|nr:hypothetical protein [Lachnospiraceae bacterium]